MTSFLLTVVESGRSSLSCSLLTTSSVSPLCWLTEIWEPELDTEISSVNNWMFQSSNPYYQPLILTLILPSPDIRAGFFSYLPSSSARMASTEKGRRCFFIAHQTWPDQAVSPTKARSQVVTDWWLPLADGSQIAWQFWLVRLSQAESNQPIKLTGSVLASCQAVSLNQDISTPEFRWWLLNIQHLSWQCIVSCQW